MAEMILIVEDELTTAKLVKMVLKKQGYRVVAVTNGAEALRLADDLVPDLILLDIVLPGMDGFQVCEYIRKSPRTKEIPVIMFSGLDRPADQRKAFLVGSDDYLTKPVKMADLLDKVRSILYLNNLNQAPQAVSSPRKRAALNTSAQP